jgi:hypothetical protein
MMHFFQFILQRRRGKIRGGIFTLLRSPGFNSKVSILPAYVARRAYFVPSHIDSSKIPVLNRAHSENQLCLVRFRTNTENVGIFIKHIQIGGMDSLLYCLLKVDSNHTYYFYLSSGVKNPFQSSADFSGITGSKNIVLDKVIQKVFIEVYYNKI